ncbi:amidohydrolase family protein [Pantoea sp. Ap-967]|uniref:amidohydrolase family protein n=1 Tax=Pantoea sp. Ap-967 TaxID=2608362 RepID=UPI0014203255|nr:amidohydrolase family protein [Pantoea sp. Ap-967]NIE72976.1 amidohydrolase family protein [Pantoea sp. Ap-967]
MISRRSVLRAVPVLAGLAILAPRFALAEITRRLSYTPSLHKVPPLACDCHVHVFDPDRFPYSESRSYLPDKSPVSILEQHLQALGVDRVVIVQPSPYGTDNRCLLDALDQLGTKRARGVAVIDDGLSEQQLRIMHAAGVRGVRVNLEVKGNADLDTVKKNLVHLAAKISNLNWHIQMYANLETIKALASTLRELPVDFVFDHYGHLDAAKGPDQEGYAEMLSLLKGGRIYVKLSALYRVSTQPDYSDVQPFAKALIAARPDRLLWASDFPHTMPPPGTTRSKDKLEYFRNEDNGLALNLLNTWIADSEILNQILVKNPERLYWNA